MCRQTEGFTDIHAHFLYGLDDGAKDHQEMEAMLDAAHADGIVNLFATPHVTPGIEPFCKVTIDDRLTEARSYCQKRGYQIRLYSGAEILYTPALEQYMTNHQLPSLGDEYHVLVEFVPNIEFTELEKAVFAFERYGYVPILAHVERYRCLYIGKRAEKLKRNHNVCFQVNADSVLFIRRFVYAGKVHALFQKELVDFVASDAHSRDGRTFHISQAYDLLKRLYGSAIAMRVTGVS